MKRSSAVKFPFSVQLFKFCHKVLMHQKGGKVRDQEVGTILNFNPSDCSHWKRGEKSVRSVFSLAKLAEALNVEPSLVHDVASGAVDLDEGFYEYMESRTFKNVAEQSHRVSSPELLEVRQRILKFVDQLLAESEFTTPPLYLPEVLRSFSFIVTQPVEMIDKLSRILRVKAGKYCIQFKKGDLKPQTRLSMVKDLARIIFEGERERFPELGPARQDMVEFEEMFFAANLLIPKSMLVREMANLDARKNVVSELSALFWVPKSLISFQLQELLKDSGRGTTPAYTKEVAGEAGAREKLQSF